MTLLEMIKKYEKDKAELIAESGSRPTGALAIVNQVLKDLKSVAEHPKLDTINEKLLKKIDEALSSGNFEVLDTLVRVFTMLPE